MDSPTDQPSIWCLLDSRPGHRNQVLGLADALQRRAAAVASNIEIHGVPHGIRLGCTLRTSLPNAKPHMIIGAGHSTHMPLLMLGRRFNAKTVVLMKPTFPSWVFDLCIVPDVYPFRNLPSNLLLTTGVLNRIRPSQTSDRKKGIILVGGPCDHHSWSNEIVLDQITEIAQRCNQSWQVATSRRTPESFVDLARRATGIDLVVTPDDVDGDWLPEQLQKCGTVWVTEDSVSMMYEAVTSGADTGIIELPKARHNRATRCVDLLVQAKDVTAFSEWQRTGHLHASCRQLSEAERCANEIIERKLLHTLPAESRSAA